MRGVESRQNKPKVQLGSRTCEIVGVPVVDLDVVGNAGSTAKKSNVISVPRQDGAHGSAEGTTAEHSDLLWSVTRHPRSNSQPTNQPSRFKRSTYVDVWSWFAALGDAVPGRNRDTEARRNNPDGHAPLRACLAIRRKISHRQDSRRSPGAWDAQLTSHGGKHDDYRENNLELSFATCRFLLLRKHAFSIRFVASL